jgi:hypothetical protein
MTGRPGGSGRTWSERTRNARGESFFTSSLSSVQRAGRIIRNMEPAAPSPKRGWNRRTPLIRRRKSPASRIVTSFKKSEKVRLKHLARQHGLTFKRFGSTHCFEDFSAHGLQQALGYVEGYDRALNRFLNFARATVTASREPAVSYFLNYAKRPTLARAALTGSQSVAPWVCSLV